MLIALIVIVAILAILLIASIAIYNSLIRMRNSVEEAFSTMDVYMKKRYDLIPNIVETVKGYAKHEKETLEKVISARNMAIDSSNGEEKIKNEANLTSTLKTLFAVSENYPDLKADKNFISLQETLKNIESEIANSRKYYNGVVKQYNNTREVFPSNIFANWFKFEKKPLYELDDIAERKNVSVKF